MWTKAVNGADVPPHPFAGSNGSQPRASRGYPMGGEWLSEADYEKLYTSNSVQGDWRYGPIRS